MQGDEIKKTVKLPVSRPLLKTGSRRVNQLEVTSLRLGPLRGI